MSCLHAQSTLIGTVFSLESRLPYRPGTPNSLPLSQGQHNPSDNGIKGSVTIEHWTRTQLTHLVSQSDFLHRMAFARLLISSFPTGLPHSQMNSSSRLRVRRDLPARVWGASMVKRFSSFAAVAGVAFPSITPGILFLFLSVRMSQASVV